jgi:hypothetical protein
MALADQSQKATASQTNVDNSICERWALRLKVRGTSSSMSKSRKKSSKARTRSKSRRWSGAVTRQSNALDLESKVFRSTDPRRIALSLKRSAQASKRRKGTPYQLAMSMLNFYDAGRSIS